MKSSVAVTCHCGHLTLEASGTEDPKENQCPSHPEKRQAVLQTKT
jgi:hypothetical protein